MLTLTLLLRGVTIADCLSFPHAIHAIVSLTSSTVFFVVAVLLVSSPYTEWMLILVQALCCWLLRSPCCL